MQHTAVPILLASLFAAPASAQKLLHELHPSGLAGGDRAGSSVAWKGSRIALGAPHADDVALEAGVVHVFKSSGASWFDGGEIRANDGAHEDLLGYSVAVDGLHVVAGAPGADVSGHQKAGKVYLFVEAIGGYVQLEVTASDPQSFDGFGTSVAFDGTRLVVGAPFAGNRGAVYVFQEGFFGWFQSAKITMGGSASARFGWSVALNGDSIVVGAPDDSGAGPSEAGAVYLFAETPFGWLASPTLYSPTPQAGAHFGHAVAMSGTDLLIGSPDHGPAGGVADVYSPAPPFSIYVHEERLTSATLNSGDEFGSAVAFDGDWAVVGAPGNDGTGAGYVFSRDSTGWVERCRLALDGGGGSLGAAVALSGKSALLGDPTSNATILQGGAAYLFDVDSVQGYGCTAANPPGSLVPVSGAPALGRTWTLGVHNPLGAQPAGSLAYLGVGGAPAAYPCGDLVPNWGMAGAGASGELLLASAPEPILVGPTAWDGLSPAPVALTLPADPAFAGQTIFVQGLMLDTSGAQVGIGLTEAVSACIGVPVP